MSPDLLVPAVQGSVTAMQLAGQVANSHAQRNEFANYGSRQAANTLRAQLADLTTFSEYLAAAGIPNAPSGLDLQTRGEAWQDMTYGLVSGFVEWLLDQGYATATVSHKLSTVKVYAKLAMKAGVLSTDERNRIAVVSAYHGQEARRIDEVRRQSGQATRKGHKKPKHTSLTPKQAETLKTHPDTPQGRRDALLMCLLLDHGLRVGEVAALEVRHFNLTDDTLTFYRSKVDKEQKHRLTPDTRRAYLRWVQSDDCPAIGPVLRGSRKGGELADAGMSERAITKRVATLGRDLLGIDNLSAHDCRHYWATQWAGKVNLFRLQEAGGWNSLAMPRRYVEAAAIANQGMNEAAGEGV